MDSPDPTSPGSAVGGLAHGAWGSLVPLHTTPPSTVVRRRALFFLSPARRVHWGPSGRASKSSLALDWPSNKRGCLCETCRYWPFHLKCSRPPPCSHTFLQCLVIPSSWICYILRDSLSLFFEHPFIFQKVVPYYC